MATEEMDPSLLLLLSNLLHLHQTLTLTLDSSSPSTSALSSPSPFPLLLFAFASALASTLLSPSPSSPSFPIPRSLSSDPILSSLNPAAFRSLFGLSHSLFHSLLSSLLPHSPSFPPFPLPPDRALSIALSRLARGASSKEIARSTSLPPSLVSRCTHAVTRILATTLYSQFVKPLPSSSSSSSASSRHTVLPNLVGSIVSSPVRLRLSDPDKSLLSPNRPFPAVLLQAVADHRRVFVDACVLAPGSVDPASHLRESSLYKRASSGKILNEPVLTLDGQKLHPYLASDASFPLLPFIFTPFSSSSSASSSTLNPACEAFDTALSKYRAASIEPAISLLKGRWKILRNLNVGLDHAPQTILACVVLHNMCQLAKEPEDDGKYLWRDPPENLQPAHALDSEWSMVNVAESLREAVADDLYERQQRTPPRAR